MLFAQEGIDPSEMRGYKTLNWVVAAAAVATIPALILSFSEMTDQGVWWYVSTAINWLIYAVFAVEAFLLIRWCGWKNYLRNNKLDVAVLALTIPVLPYPLKVFWTLRLLRLLDSVPALFSSRTNWHFAYLAAVLYFFALYAGGLSFHHFEGVSIFDGIYWANTTLTSVGYGDLSPETVPGKIVAMLVQISGAIALLLGLGQIDEYVRSKREQVESERAE
jgi:voltage-gated potassium channel